MSLAVGKESSFGFEELFFSRTNSKGVIESGNSVFQRVSQFDWDDLLNKPHSLIRHPAMPRGVFHLLWETILSGNPIGAYVVNQAKDTSHYWVFALVTPIDGGFLSVRLKPSSPVFSVVKQKYSELLEIERTQKISPKESQAILIQVIKSLNFGSYHQFMTETLAQEIGCRQKNLKLDPIQAILQLRKVLRLGTDLQKRCADIFSAHHASRFVPLNLEIKAAKIGQEAAPLAVISAQYESLAKKIRQEIQKFSEAGKLVHEQIERCQFDVCNSLLQKEMVQFFRNETKSTPVQKNIEMAHLERVSNLGLDAARLGLKQIDIEFSKFKSVYEEVRNIESALEIVSISGRIEAAKIEQSSTDLSSLLNELVQFKRVLRVSLKDIDDIGKDLVFRARQINDEITL